MSSKESVDMQCCKEESDTFSGEKNCRLCRKLLSNDHFLNPKSGSLFAVCDICRKRKRDKYWKNKEVMRQSLLEASYLLKPKYTSYRRNRSSSTSDKSEETTCSSPHASSETCYQDSNAHFESVTTPYNHKNTQCKKAPSLQSQGHLIIVPPQFLHFVQLHRSNPSFIRKAIGDYYWNELCLGDMCKCM